MSYLSGLDSLLHVFGAYPQLAGPLLELGEAIMRGPAPFEPGERELLAAYVSALNDCGFCQESHTSCALQFGQPAGLAAQYLENPEGTSLPNPKLEPVLRYVKTLTLAPKSVRQADVDAILAAGWEREAVIYANAICGFFSQLNRLVEGLGIPADAEISQMAGQVLYEGGYRSILAGPEV